MDLGEAALIAVVVFMILGGGAFVMDIYHTIDDELNAVEIDAVGDDGVYKIEGDGKHREGDSVTLSVIVYLGWIFDGWYDSSGNLLSSSSEYTLDAEDVTIFANTHRGYGVEIYAMDGAYVEGRGSYELNETAVVEAWVRNDETFKGWYDADGNLLSKSSTYTVPSKEDCTLIAKTSGDTYDGSVSKTYTVPSNMVPSTVTWAITNRYTGDYVDSSTGSSLNSSLLPGFYTVTMAGFTDDGKYVKTKNNFSIKGDITSHFHWYYGNRWYSLDWTISYDAFQSYVDYDVNRSPQTDSSRSAFVNYKSATVTSVAQSLMNLGRGMSENDYANFVLTFVQDCTDYEYDSDFCNQDDYWKYPAEMLMQRKGDCEDGAILYCALMKASGFDVALLLYLGERYVDDGHAAAGVALTNVPGGTYYDKDGKHYYYCETTSDTAVGVIWDRYDCGQVLVIK